MRGRTVNSHPDAMTNGAAARADSQRREQPATVEPLYERHAPLRPVNSFQDLSSRAAAEVLWQANAPRVAIVGAGTSGMACAAELIKHGIRPVLIERTAAAGGVWGPLPHLAVYHPLTQNTSPTQMSLRENPRSQPSNGLHFSIEEYSDHVESYFWSEGLDRIAYFGCEATLIERAGNGKQAATVHIAASPPGTPAEATVKLAVDHVVYAGGMFHAPFRPTIAGLSSFAGPVVHSCEIETAETFRDLDVVIVGLGNTALDVALRLQPLCRSVTISGRTPTWILPRVVDGRPLDDHVRYLRGHHGDAYTAQLYRDCIDHGAFHFGRQTDAGKLDFRRVRILTNSEVLPLLHAGLIHLTPAIDAVVANGVTLAGGRVLRSDALVLCTGYQVHPPRLSGLDYPGAPLVANVLHPDCDWFWFLGVTPIWGGTVALARRQARLIAAAVSGGASGDMLRQASADGPVYDKADFVLPLGFEVVDANSFAEHLESLQGRLEHALVSSQRQAQQASPGWEE